jgi:ATP-dependent protease ClpP protease subunit
MFMMDEQAKTLLTEHHIIILPEDINHATYVMMVEALHIMKDDPLALYCRGDGGETRCALAIVDLIKRHGKVTGILPGAAMSSHAMIFAACAYRYIYPNATIGVHQTAVSAIDTRFDSRYAQQIANEFDINDRQTAVIMAGASNKSEDDWYEIIRSAGSGSYTCFNAEAMIEMNMARPIDEFVEPIGREIANQMDKHLEQLDQFIKGFEG